MTRISVWVVALVLLTGVSAQAQTVPAQPVQRPTSVPNQQNSNGQFGTQWAKPPSTTGGQIYNDPRTRDPNSSYRSQRSKPCVAPTISDSAGGCR
jgi:hypothetical protein